MVASLDSYIQALSKVILSAVDLTSKTVDYYLPPSPDEIEEQEAQQEQQGTGDSGPSTPEAETIRNVIRKVASLSNKMRLRVTRQASTSLSSLQQKSHETMDMVKAFDLMKYVKTLEEVSRQSLTTISTYPAQTLSRLAISAVDLADKTVDYYLPPSEDEIQEQQKQLPDEQQNGDSNLETVDLETIRNIIKRAGNLSNKVRVRVTRQASTQLQSLQQRGYNTLEQVRSNLDLVKYAKALEDTVRSHLSNLPSFSTQTLAKMALSALDFADKTFEYYLPHSDEKMKEQKAKESKTDESQ